MPDREGRSQSPRPTKSPRSKSAHQHATSIPSRTRGSVRQSDLPSKPPVPLTSRQPKRVPVDRKAVSTTRERKSSDANKEVEDGEYVQLPSGEVSAAPSEVHSPSDEKEVHEVPSGEAESAPQTALPQPLLSPHSARISENLSIYCQNF